LIINKEKLIELYLDGFPTDGEKFARYFVSARTDDEIAVALCDDKVVSVGYLIDKKGELFGKELTLPYFSALSTISNFRGKGYIGQVIIKLLNKALKKSAPFVALSPFSDSFYKKFDFVDASYCGKTQISGISSYQIKPCEKNDFIRMYNDFTKDYSFKLIYGENEYENLKEELELYGQLLSLHDNQGKVVAVVACDDKNIFKYAHEKSFSLETVEELKGKILRDFSKKEKVFAQIRLASVEDFFKSVRYQEDNFSYSIRLTDDILEENSGVYTVVSEQGKISVFKLPSKVKIAATVDYTAAELIKAFLDGVYPFVKPSVHFQDEY
jgi:predicted acetyltransferase